MFENDSIQSFQRSTARRTKPKGAASAAKPSKDDFIMDTNNSSIVSKRSVEKLYWAGQPEYFRYFVSKFKRRSPLINRGYWLRMNAVESTVERFLSEPSKKHKLVVNLGCGYDPLPWLFLGKRAHLCQNATFVDVDYPPLMRKKVDVIQQTPQLYDILPELSATTSEDGLLCRSTNYAAIGCDLRNLDLLDLVLREQMDIEICSVAILFVAEVSIAYMDYDGSQAVLSWAAKYDDVRFCLLEQHLPDGPDHPFAETMLKHFEKLRTPLHAIGTLQDMHGRFVKAGWPQDEVYIRTLWSFWSDDQSVTPEERQSLDAVEPFDEWEEFALFGSHYFLLVARKSQGGWPERYWSSRTAPKSSSEIALENSANNTVQCKPLDSVSSHRRFAAIIPSIAETQAVGIHGGLGTKERLRDTATYDVSQSGRPLDGPSLRNGLMCHTITQLNARGDCLLVGGRRSPTEASARCWLRQHGTWKEDADLPCGRYRHSTFRTTCEDGTSGVVVIGGKASDGSLCSDILLWRESIGWTTINCLSEMPPLRFGAVSLADDSIGATGLYFGGICSSGIVLEGIWRWTLIGTTIRFVEKDIDADTNNPELLWRFGAQITSCHGSDKSAHRLLVGGIGGSTMLTRNTDLYNIDEFRPMPIVGPRPLFIGMSLHGSLCLGGGATCFSFGTYWSNATVLGLEADGSQVDWKSVLESSSLPLKNSAPDLPYEQSHETSLQVPSVISSTITSADDFQRLLNRRRPVILRNSNIGSCISSWTPEYLKAKIGPDREVSVHSATSVRMDFQTKNFTYVKQKFGDFVDNVIKGDLLYLRALSAASPSEQPTTLSKDYPEIANDFHLPPELRHVTEHMHSAPLRISSRVRMWLHYDVMANVLCQVRGRKRLVLFPPSDVMQLGFEAGASSSSLDVSDPCDSTQAALAKCHPQEALLEPGDILFIPPLWLHTAMPTDDISVAVNVFFRDLQSGYAAGRDVYGNRDLAAYERGRRDVSKLVKSFSDVPADMSQFYLERLAGELSSLARSS